MTDGWTYHPERDVGEDVVKLFHEARRGDEVRSVDHSSYQPISAEAFAAHVLLGFPARLGRTPWRNDEIIGHATANGFGPQLSQVTQ